MSIIHQRRVPVEGIFRVGEVRKIAHVLSIDGSETFTAGTVRINIYDSAGTLVVTAGVGVANPVGAAAEVEIYYIWTPSTAGDYRYQFTAVIGSETLACRGEVYVFPVVSKYDRWIETVRGYIQEPGGGEEEQLLSTRDYVRAVDAARRRYQRDWPQRKLNNAAGEVMTTAWEYALPADWVDGFSQILELEYPVDATLQARPFLDPSAYYVDPLRLKWSFRDTAPTAGEYTRFTYTTEHVLSHTADTLPSHHFDAIATWAAGEALEYLANEATRTDARTVGAEIANFRTKQQERRAQAATMKAQAVQMWANPVWSL